MSGHSKWANIKHKKGIEDKKRGQIFSKLAKAITVAVKEGGSSDPKTNSRLRMIIAQARVANMPKNIIDRALKKGSSAKENLEAFILEGYTAWGVAVIVEVLTNNRQRTVQEVKNFFQRHQGNLAEPGSVSFQFDKRGEVIVEDPGEKKALVLMEAGVLDFVQRDGRIIFYLLLDKIEDFKKLAREEGVKVLSWGVTMRPKNKITLADKDKIAKTTAFLNELAEHEDVQNVFSNLSC